MKLNRFRHNISWLMHGISWIASKNGTIPIEVRHFRSQTMSELFLDWSESISDTYYLNKYLVYRLQLGVIFKEVFSSLFTERSINNVFNWQIVDVGQLLLLNLFSYFMREIMSKRISSGCKTCNPLYQFMFLSIAKWWLSYMCFFDKSFTCHSI